jgi:hypothetical protein
LTRGLALLAALSFAPSLRAEPGAPRPRAEVRPGAESFDDRHRPEAEPWRRYPLALETQVGMGAPLGLAGLALDCSPSAGFSANFGAGLGNATKSLQLATVLRLRFVIAHGFATGSEGGLAFGRYERHIDCPDGRCPPSWSWNRAVWGNVGLFLERRSDAGLTLRWSFGGTSIFNGAAADCERCTATDEPNTWVTTLPYTMLAVGWAFRP